MKKDKKKNNTAVLILTLFIPTLLGTLMATSFYNNFGWYFAIQELGVIGSLMGLIAVLLIMSKKGKK